MCREFILFAISIFDFRWFLFDKFDVDLTIVTQNQMDLQTNAFLFTLISQCLSINLSTVFVVHGIHSLMHTI